MKNSTKTQLQLIINFIGNQIDSEIRMSMNDMNELWQWLSDVLGDEE